MDKVLFTSNKQDWETPQWLFDKLNNYFHFTLDACASHENAKCKEYEIIENNSLTTDWHYYNTIWCNPPYNELYKWVQKCYEESLKGCTVVMLIPSRTETRVWHDYVGKGRVTLLKGRLKFSGAKHSAPFPSCIVVFGKQYDASIRVQADDFLFKE